MLLTAGAYKYEEFKLQQQRRRAISCLQRHLLQALKTIPLSSMRAAYLSVAVCCVGNENVYLGDFDGLWNVLNPVGRQNMHK